ncbi:MAG: DUF937 domain-containing protein [Gemmatimonadota bacterium]|nr:DUF937 domain-containing protein [Gemmatimonadota bacterium]
MSLIDLVKQELGPSGIQNISQQIGADPAATERAVTSALPMMVGGMASTAQQAGGENALQSAIGALGGGGGAGGGGGMLGGLGGLLGGGILGSILGQHHSTVQDGVQQASGLDAGKVGKLLILLAPFIIRALAKHQSSRAAQQQAGGMAGSLQKEAQDAAANAGPHVGGILGQILGGLGA